MVDGDTLHLQIDGRTEKARLIGVNTPEISHPGLNIKEQPYGREAADYTRKQLNGRQIYLELDAGERDRYGRLLVYVWLEQPANDSEAEVRAKMHNADLLINGYAEIMTVPPNVKYTDLFAQLQQEARQAGRGIWREFATKLPPAPDSSSADKYIGNSNSKKFHIPGCRWAGEISPENRVQFSTRTEALEAGYQPCKTCKP